jgi:large repetitive protein
VNVKTQRGGWNVDRLLAIAFLFMLTVALAGMSAHDTAASFTGTSSNPSNTLQTLNVQPPASHNNTTSAAAGVVNLSWTATPTAPGAGHTLTYLVLRGPVGGPYAQVGSTTSLTYSDTPPADGTYQYVIQAQITGGGSFTSGNSAAKSGISDRTAPTKSITCNGGSCASWFNATVSVTVSGTDGGTGMGSVTRNVDGGGQTSTAGASATFNVSGENASHTVAYFTTDAAGNASSSANQTVKIDLTAPTAPGGITASSGSSSGQLDVTGTSAGTDALSGVAGYRAYYVQATACPAAPYGSSQYFAGNPPAVPLVLTGLASGQKYCVYLRTVDNAGNESANSNIAGPTKAK